MQIDWLSGTILPTRSLTRDLPLYETGKTIQVDPDGVINWIRPAFVPFKGSFDASIVVTSNTGHDLHISGNPVKFFQGHNLFGSEEASPLFLAMGEAVRRDIGLFPSPGTWDSCGFSGPRFSRADITRSYRFPTDDYARAWLREVAASARSRHGGALVRGTTVYHGKNSRHWTMKIYLKSDELKARGKGHHLSEKLSIRDRDLLTDWSTGVVRFELTLRSLELGRPIADIKTLTLYSIWQRYFERITFNRNAAPHIEDLMMTTLTRAERSAHFQWQHGKDLRAEFSKSGFYKLRSALLTKLAIDIAVPPVVEDSDPVDASLDPVGWDPHPIEHLVHRPSPQLMISYPDKEE
jgi:hypothetical protein